MAVTITKIEFVKIEITNRVFCNALCTARPSGPRRPANPPPASVAAALARRYEAEAVDDDSQPALPAPNGRPASQDVTLEHVLRQLAPPPPPDVSDGD